jgi:hypothetical protein
MPSFEPTSSVMHPPARICRAIVQDIIGRAVFTDRQRDRTASLPNGAYRHILAWFHLISAAASS